MKNVTLNHQGPVKGEYAPPGDKSISHRAIMFGALSDGKSRFSNFLEGEDCLHTMKAFQSLGISIDRLGSSGEIEIQGKGLRGLSSPAAEIYLGNSGTSMRLLLGILSGQKFETVLAGDPSLSARPMKRVTVPLKQMGAQIKGRDQGNFAPLTIRGSRLKAIEFENELGSAQVKSALLFAGMYADGLTRIHELRPSRDHTERFLQAAGAQFKINGDFLEIGATEKLKPLSFEIPGDISSAAFFITAAAMMEGSELTVKKVGLNPQRIGLIQVLKRMGASIEMSIQEQTPEPVGTIHVRGCRLKGTRLSKKEIPGLIDEIPVLMTAMALAEGESLISGAEELRVKETDRIISMVTNLSKVGADIRELPDGCLIRGVESFRSGSSVHSYGDHRTVMSMAIANLAMDGEIILEDIDCVMTSFPSFFEDLKALCR